MLTLTLTIKSVRVIFDTQPLSTHCYLITMWTVNTYSGVARLELLDTEENIAVHLRPPYLFMNQREVIFLYCLGLWVQIYGQQVHKLPTKVLQESADSRAATALRTHHDCG